jgi:predicted nuclease of predicted toxin-antitoxin system
VLRLLFDQHAGEEVYDRLAASNRFDVVLVRDVQSLGPEADDTEIWRYAVENDQVVFTNDEDFVDGKADPGDGTHPGAIRFTGKQWGRIAEAVEAIEGVTNTEGMAEYGIE